MNRGSVLAVVLVWVMGLSGCAGGRGTEETSPVNMESVGVEQGTGEMSEVLEEICGEIYEEALASGTLGQLEVVREMVNRLGEEGYVVIDQDSQVDMRHAQALDKFCDSVKEQQTGEVMFLMVLNNGGFVQFQMETEDGVVKVAADSLWWKEQKDGVEQSDRWRLVNIGTDSYEASAWVRSENGYLFFEKPYMAGFSGPYGHTAVRIEPLDENCRELNRQYLLPLGYGSNNLFITDWNENDYGKVDFQDLFEVLYQKQYFATLPYSPEREGESVPVPEKEFEHIIAARINITQEALREKTTYDKESHTYQYSPRGLYNQPSGGEIPYPEVTSYQYNGDGTIELTVNAVWPEQNLGTAFLHQVTVRPMSGGGFQYILNQVLPPGTQVPASWYAERIAAE